MRCKNKVWITTALFMAVVLLTGVNVFAAQWVGVVDPNLGIADAGRWLVDTNWSTGLIPVAGEKTQFGGSNKPACVIDGSAVSGQTVVGDGGDTLLQQVIVVDGGIWNTTGTAWTSAGYNRAAAITVERGGSMTTEHRVGVGLVGSSTPANPSYLNVNGGLVDIGGNLQIGTTGSHIGIVTVNSGLLEANGWEWRDTAGTWSLMNVRHGTVIIDGDHTGSGDADDVDSLVASGALYGFDGDGTISAVFDGAQTSITSSDPLNRTPAMDAVVPAGPVTLSWDNVGTPYGVAVYFGTELDSLVQQTDPNTSGALTELVVSAPVFDEYIWRVDTYASAPGVDPNDPLVGDTMYFVASTDVTPVVEMNTPPTATWAGNPTELQVTVYDDGESDVTVTWSAEDTSGDDAGPIVDPNVVFDPPSTVIPAQASYSETGIIVTTTMTVDYHAAQMVATATAVDSNPLGEEGSATVALDCADSACQATTAIFNLDEQHPGDIVVDCVIDLTDFAAIASEWLTDYTLIGPAAIE